MSGSNLLVILLLISTQNFGVKLYNWAAAGFGLNRSSRGAGGVAICIWNFHSSRRNARIWPSWPLRNTMVAWPLCRSGPSVNKTGMGPEVD